ncbi:MAG: tetratricopeptide repeat protein [Deferrisomatales bacterium]|nr:tetratricopeptide repeat protein [Deferrisomatales bacterium]
MACAPMVNTLPVTQDAMGRHITARKTLPSRVNLLDHSVETLGVLAFAGPSGGQLADDLASQVEATGAFRVVGPQALNERLMRLGLSVNWDAAPSSLLWVYERAAVDAVIVGRVEVFDVEGRENAKDTPTLVDTEEMGFVINDEGKLVYGPKQELRQIPLYCRTVMGTVAASYRSWGARSGELIATVRHELVTEIPVFCYRGDVPVELARDSQDRILRRFLNRLNKQFLEDIIPQTVRDEILFETLPGDAGGAQVQRTELAILYAERGDWKRAIEVLQDCLRDRPDLAAVHYNLAVAYGATGQVTRAREHLRKALLLAPRKSLYQQALYDVPVSSGNER